MDNIDNKNLSGKPKSARRSESCLDRYFITPFFRRYSDFNGADGMRTMLLSLAAFAIVTCGIAGILTGLVGILGVETGMVCLIVLGIAWILGLMVPLAAVCVRGMREPEPADRDMQRRRVRLVTIDIFVMTVCALFLIFGILNMVTTMRSEELNPECITEEEPEDTATDSIVDEPIFTYQQIDAPTEPDPLQGYEEETDTVSVTESFDPTIEPAEKAEQEIVETIDSI